MDELRQLLADLRSFDILLFRLGNSDITIFALIKLALLVAAGGWKWPRRTPTCWNARRPRCGWWPTRA